MKARGMIAAFVVVVAGTDVWAITQARSGAVSQATPPRFTIRSSSISAGGTKSSGGGFSAASTSGQPAAGAMSGGKFAMTGGFSPGPAFLPGDCVIDEAVDLLDYKLFESCLFGPNQTDGSGCGCFDLDASDAVDLLDFAELANAFTEG